MRRIVRSAWVLLILAAPLLAKERPRPNVAPSGRVTTSLTLDVPIRLGTLAICTRSSFFPARTVASAS